MNHDKLNVAMEMNMQQINLVIINMKPFTYCEFQLAPTTAYVKSFSVTKSKFYIMQQVKDSHYRIYSKLNFVVHVTTNIVKK